MGIISESKQAMISTKILAQGLRFIRPNPPMISGIDVTSKKQATDQSPNLLLVYFVIKKDLRSLYIFTIFSILDCVYSVKKLSASFGVFL